MRVHVKPALPDATIPDPARGRDLPPEGLPCEWSVHWARLKARGDVIVTELSETDPVPPADGESGLGDLPQDADHAKAEDPPLELSPHPDA